jgi:very-short-patch-repair endonuclease
MSYPVSEALLAAIRAARGQGGVLTYRQALSAGLTRAQIQVFVARGWWLHPVKDAYVVGAVTGASDDPLAGLRARARAAALVHPGAVVGGLTAARLLGFGPVADAADEAPVQLVVPGRGVRRSARGLECRVGELGEGEVVRAGGIPLTAPARTLADVVLAAETRQDAVALMDAALHAGLVADTREAQAATAWRPGCRRAETWWPLADGRSESVLETRTRLVLVDHGLRPEQLQWEVRAPDGRFVARVDLAYPSRQVAIEADGARFHGGPGWERAATESGRPRSRTRLPDQMPAGCGPGVRPLFQDRRRQNALAGTGWRVVRATWLDVVDRPDRLIQEIHAALAPPP